MAKESSEVASEVVAEIAPEIAPPAPDGGAEVVVEMVFDKKAVLKERVRAELAEIQAKADERRQAAKELAENRQPERRSRQKD